MNRHLVAVIALLVGLVGFVSAGPISCGREHAPDHPQASSQAAASARGAAPTVRINGYVIDVKGAPPAVPPGLDTFDPDPTTGVVTVPLPDVLVRGQGGMVPPGKRDTGGATRAVKWIVQLEGPVRSADARQLAAFGEIGEYLPDFAFVVTTDRASADRIAGLPFVRGVVRVKPAYKLARALAAALAEGSNRSLGIRVRVDRPGDLAAVLSEVHASRGSVRAVGRDLATVQVQSPALARLARLERVAWIEEAPVLRLLNDVSSWTIQTYVPGDRRIWSQGVRGDGQIVGVGDTGLDHDMCFFADPAGAPIGPGHRKVVGYASFADTYDGNMGHGTHVSGTVAGDQTPITGASTASGMAPEASCS